MPSRASAWPARVCVTSPSHEPHGPERDGDPQGFGLWDLGALTASFWARGNLDAGEVSAEIVGALAESSHFR